MSLTQHACPACGSSHVTLTYQIEHYRPTGIYARCLSCRFESAVQPLSNDPVEDDKLAGLAWDRLAERVVTEPQNAACDVIGPYLGTTVTCPVCQAENRITFHESYTGPIQDTVSRCPHLYARVIDAEGSNRFVFLRDPS